MCIVYLQIVLCLPRCGDSILTMLFCIEMFYTSITSCLFLAIPFSRLIFSTENEQTRVLTCVVRKKKKSRVELSYQMRTSVLKMVKFWFGLHRTYDHTFLA